MCIGTGEHLRPTKALKVLTPMPQLSTLAKNRANTGFSLSCSLSTLGEQLSVSMSISMPRVLLG